MPRPAFTAQQVVELSVRVYGLNVDAGSAKQLGGYDDANWYLKCDDGTGAAVLKIMNTSTHPGVDVLEAHCTAMQHLRLGGVQCPTPRPVVLHNEPGCGMQHVALVAAHDMADEQASTSRPSRQQLTPQRHPVLCLEWLPGTLLQDTAQSRELFHQLGQFMGRVSCCLASLHAPALHVKHAWRLEDCASTLAAKLPVAWPLMSEGQRALISAVQGEWSAAQAAGLLEALPSQVCHGDANEANVLVDSTTGQISGLIDYGDMSVTWRVSEAAITATYAALLAAERSLQQQAKQTKQAKQQASKQIKQQAKPAQPRPTAVSHTSGEEEEGDVSTCDDRTVLDSTGKEEVSAAAMQAATAVLGGFTCVQPLTCAELAVVPLLVRARIAVSLTQGLCSAHTDPTNAAYTLQTQRPGWAVLQAMPGWGSTWVEDAVGQAAIP